MPVLPKSFYSLATGLLTARAIKRFRRPNTASAAQQKNFRELVSQFSRTEQGRQSGVTASTTYAQFAQQVPLQTYATIQPQIERMQHGEADVLWPGQCSLYAKSAGATDGQPKELPITEDMLQHLCSAAKTSLLYYTTRVGHAGIFRGRHVYLTDTTSFYRIKTSGKFESYLSNLGGIGALNLPAWAEKHYYEPGESIARQTDATKRIRDCAKRTQHCDISLIAGQPNQLLNFAATSRKYATRGKAKPLNLQGIWPNLECVIHGGIPLGHSSVKLRDLSGPEINFHEVYPTTEGFIGAQDADPAMGLRLIADAGIFYEFIPLANYHDDHLDKLGSAAIPLSMVKPGVEYVIVMTTPAGLCRYVLGDIVRFSDTQFHRFTLLGRTQLRLNTFGENVLERQVTDVLLKVCQQHSWTITNFHLAALPIKSLTGQLYGQHEWWIELKPGTVDTPTGPVLAPKLDQELQRANPSYAAKRKGGILEAPVVRLVMPGVFDHWLEHNRKWDPQGKMPHCSSSREIADGLAQLARFTHD